MKVTKFSSLMMLVGFAAACNSEPNDNGDLGRPTSADGSVLPGERPTIASVVPKLGTGTTTVTLQISGTSLTGCDFDLNGDTSSLKNLMDVSASDKTIEIDAAMLKTLAPLSVAWLRATRRGTKTQSEPYLFSAKFAEPTTFSVSSAQGIAQGPDSQRLGFVPKINTLNNAGVLSVNAARTQITIQTNPVVVVTSPAATADVAWMDMNNDKIPDLVYLTIEKLTTGYPLTAYIHYGSMNGINYSFKTAYDVRVMLTSKGFGNATNEPKCDTNVQAKLLVADLDNNGYLDLAAQWYCVMIGSANYSYSYQAVQEPSP